MALKFGERTKAPTSRAQVRARLGAFYARPSADTPDDRIATFAGDFGVAFEWQRDLDAAGSQMARFTGGIDGRWGPMESTSSGHSNFVDLQLGVVVPTTDGTYLATGFRLPIASELDRSPVLTVSGNFATGLGKPQ